MRRAAALVLLVCGLALSACGGDDDDGGGSGTEDYIAEADAICKRLNDRIEEANERQPTNFTELRELLDTGIELTDEGLDEFDELEVPEQIQGEVGEFLESARRQREVLAEARAADSAQEAARILREELPAIEEQRRESAREIGFEECGQGA